MGNDLDVCSKDEVLNSFAEQQYGPQNETVFQFIYRVYNKFCDSLIHPQKILYDLNDLKPKFLIEEDNLLWTVHEFDVLCGDNKMHCCYWQYKETAVKENNYEKVSSTAYLSSVASAPAASTSSESSLPRLILVYLPTNQRSLKEATEIFPLIRELKCDMFSFDYAGCGKSEGAMHENIDHDIEYMLDYLQKVIGNYEASLIIWARGMSAALIILMLSRITKQQFDYYQWKQQQEEQQHKSDVTPRRRWIFSPRRRRRPSFQEKTVEEIEEILTKQQLLKSIKCLVLDSPFLTVEDIVKNGVEKMNKNGYYLGKSIIYFVIRTIMRNISKRLNGFNLFSVKPVEHITWINYFPCCILSADNDDYIPIHHGETIAKLWKNDDFVSELSSNSSIFGNIYGNIQFNIINGRHFTKRKEEIIEITYDFLRHHLKDATNPRYDTDLWFQLLDKQHSPSQPRHHQVPKRIKNKTIECESFEKTSSVDGKEFDVNFEESAKEETFDESMKNDMIPPNSNDGLSVLNDSYLNESFVSSTSQGETVHELVQLIDFEEFEESLTVINEEEEKEIENSVKSVYSLTLKPSISATHLPSTQFDSSSLLWIQSTFPPSSPKSNLKELS
jgi:hypothetical protein